ncbi:hypothetical protein H6G94_24920 [Nostoc punctiforme FACHB-252]|uniref:Transposase n=1 Tax=Nostoc punctiforme FACHB-252 TaxID=1357509 RepID=A0ABR8HFA9_NOSPU|nr:hypothetical protein [Nostoc punctiforme FACHB-252]
MLRIYGGTAEDFTEGYINGAARIFKNKTGGRFWFGVAVKEEVKTA